MPAKAGIQFFQSLMDSRFRENDKKVRFSKVSFTEQNSYDRAVMGGASPVPSASSGGFRKRAKASWSDVTEALATTVSAALFCRSAPMIYIQLSSFSPSIRLKCFVLFVTIVKP